MFLSKDKKSGTPKTTDKQKRTDEIITVVLPTIKDK
jgi:hypothetical protein